MISPELRFEGFDARAWTNLLSLFFPGVVECSGNAERGAEIGALEGESASGSLFVIVDEERRVLQAFHSSRGRVRGLSHLGEESLESLCRAHASTRIVVLREGAMEELSERMAMRMQRGDDYLSQWLIVLRSWREMQDEGSIQVWPRGFSHFPLPTPNQARVLLDWFLPQNRVLLAVLWDKGTPWTALALHRGKEAIDLVAGPDLISLWTGPLGGDWRRDYRVITRAISRSLAPVHLGFFGEVSTLQHLLQHPTPGAWARAVTIRDLIVYPTPPYIPMILGADLARALGRSSAAWFASRPLPKVFSPLQRRVSQWFEAPSVESK